MQSLFADPQVQLILGIVLFAVALRVGMGLARRGIRNVNIPVIIMTGLIAVLIGVGVVSEIIHDDFGDLSPTQQLTIIAAGILTIYGSQAVFDKAKALADSKNYKAPGTEGN